MHGHCPARAPPARSRQALARTIVLIEPCKPEHGRAVFLVKCFAPDGSSAAAPQLLQARRLPADALAIVNVNNQLRATYPVARVHTPGLAGDEGRFVRELIKASRPDDDAAAVGFESPATILNSTQPVPTIYLG